MEILNLISEAEKRGQAIGHFNFCNLEILKAIAIASKEANQPVLVGVSEGERVYVGRETALAMVRSVAKEIGAELFISADHTKSLNEVKTVIDLGYDFVVADGSSLAFKDNIDFTKESLSYAKEKNPEAVIEGELGFIGNSSEILDELPENLSELSSPEQVAEFVALTEVPIISPALGNIHGVLKDLPHPKIDFERIKEIKEKTGIFVTLHGGSGIPDGDIKKAVDSGINIVHFNSDLRSAFKIDLKEALELPTIAPYKYLNGVVLKLAEVVKSKIDLLNKK